MLCPPKLLDENFPSDRDYTLQSLVEQLGLMELHIRDGSWRLCDCNPEKHLPLAAGLASEGFGFAESDDESLFMECLMNQARVFKSKIRKGEYRTQEQMNILKDWAREGRHRIEERNWSGNWTNQEKYGDSSEILEESKRLLAEMKNMKVDLAHYQDNEDFLSMEKEMAQKLIDRLSAKYGVKPPELFINDECHEPMIGLYSANRIMVCQTGINLHVLAHEFWHHVQKERGMHMDEGEAEKFAVNLFEPEFQKGLYSFHTHSHNESKMVKSIKDVGIIYGLQQVGFATDYALKYADTLRPEGLLGQPLSLWGDILGVIGGIWGAMKLKAPYDLAAAMVGGYLSTDLWRHLARVVPLTRVATPPLVYTPPGTVTTPAITSAGRYAIITA